MPLMVSAAMNGRSAYTFLLYQALQGFRHPMDRVGPQNLKSLRQRLVGNGNPALREVLKECACLCVRGQPIVLPQARHCHDRAWSPPRADDLDRPRPLHDDPIALSISALHRVAAGLVVGSDDVLDVGVGNERYDTVAPPPDRTPGRHFTRPSV